MIRNSDTRRQVGDASGVIGLTILQQIVAK
jgi:hypothetical protein